MLFYIFYALWKCPNRGLGKSFTVKGKKECRGRAKCYVRMCYRKDFVMCNPYTRRLNAERHCKITIPRIDDSIQNSSSPRAKRILQDNCPVMNATFVVDALTDIGTMRFKIPAHTPYINCIENVFHVMRKETQQNVVKQGIEKETFLQFQKPVRRNN